MCWHGKCVLSQVTLMRKGQVMFMSIFHNKSERRVRHRRECKDRRAVVRFGDVLGRRSGTERRGADSSK